MKTADLGKGAMTVGLVAAGVIVAGWIMKTFRSQVSFLNDASNGFDT